MLSELYKLSKLIRQKKKCCDYKLWKCFLQCSFFFFQMYCFTFSFIFFCN